MSNLPEYFGVEKAGAIRLGKDVVADGTDVANESTLRIQSHAHSDHLKDYKHYLNHPRKLITTEGTKDILLAENRTIKRRIGGRLIVLNTDEARTIDGKKIILYDANHMIGSAQTVVEYKNGDRFGYSGDFGWPLDKVLKADFLVLDSTYSSFQQGNNQIWNRDTAFRDFGNIILERKKYGPIHIYAHTGVLQECAQYILRNLNEDFTFFGTEDVIALNSIFSDNGMEQPQEIKDISKEQYSDYENVVVLRKYNTRGSSTNFSTILDISNRGASNNSPIKTKSEIDDKIYKAQICITKHAKGNEVKEYIEKTEAKLVITDSYEIRAGLKKATELSNDIKKVLGIESFPSHELDYWEKSTSTYFE